jgi:hypothetical protein
VNAYDDTSLAKIAASEPSDRNGPNAILCCHDPRRNTIITTPNKPASKQALNNAQMAVE